MSWFIVPRYLLIFFLVISFAIYPDLAEAKAYNRSMTMPVTYHRTTSLALSELESFFDQMVPQQLEDRHIPGAALAVVKNGEVVFSKGYGFADLEQAQPVVAGQTLFRTGSVAKLFTWTAVMQLVEQGKLELHTDVNHYLTGFQIPATFSEPITLEHLITHTAGFEDGPVGMMRSRPEDLEPLETFLARKVPARVFRPGQVTAYSNYGTTLASHIVENISGLSFEEYVEQNILTPLNMADTTFRQPVPAAYADRLASGYVFNGDGFESQPFEVMQIAPAGGASATVNDMAKFMIAHLHDGQYGDTRILGEQTAQQMHALHFSNDPRLSGMAYGFYQAQVNGRILLTHAGETSFFRSQLYLLPQEDLGLYVVYNAAGGGPARQELIQAFFDRFYPADLTTVPQPAAGAAQRSSQFPGRYIPTRSAQTTIEKLRLLFEPLYQPITVRATGDGSLETDHPVARSQNPTTYQPGRWAEVEPGFYQQVNGSDKMAFRQDDQSGLMLFFDSAAPKGYRRLAGYEALLFQPLLPLGLVVVLLAVMAFAAFDKQAVPAARWLAMSMGGVVLAFFIGVVAFALLGFTAYLYGQLSSIWWAVFALPLLLILLTIALAVFTLRPWPEASLARHIPYALAVTAAAGLLGWFQYWNLLGWRF